MEEKKKGWWDTEIIDVKPNIIRISGYPVELVLPVHEAQLLSYLKLSGIRTGLLINFHAITIRDGIKRMIL